MSLVAGAALEKFRYHMPLYHQAEKLGAAGIRVSRSTLCGIVQQGAELLEPVYEALKSSVLAGGVITMDETPIRAGAQEPAVLLERGPHANGDGLAEPDRHLPTAGDRSAKLPDRRPAPDRVPSSLRRRPAHPASVE